MPVSPVHDLVVKHNDLVVATHGRGFWILDDVTPLRQLAAGIDHDARHLFAPAAAYRIRNDFVSVTGPAGENPPPGAIIYYWLPRDAAGGVELAILDAAGTVVRAFSSRPVNTARHLDPVRLVDIGVGHRGPAAVRVGFAISPSRAARRPPAVLASAARAAGGPARAARAVPGPTDGGRRDVDTAAGDSTDPRLQASDGELKAQFYLHISIRDLLSAVTAAITKIRELRADLAGRQDKGDRTARLTAIEQALIEPRMQVGSDAFQFPLRGDNKLVVLMGIVANSDRAPTRAAYEVFEELERQVRVQLDELRRLEGERR